MKELSHILEEELAEAVEVKNRESLHRYIVLLTERMVEQHEHDIKHEQLMSAMREGFARMDERFAVSDAKFDAMNRRFEDMNKRFEDMNKRFEDTNKRFEDTNKRFEDTNRRFNGLQKLIVIEFSVLGLLIAGINLALFFFR
jgi:peptidoglycan hydrolase CwlO-like protein